MPIIYRKTFSDLTGFTSDTANGTITANVSAGGLTNVRFSHTGSDDWNGLSIIRTSLIDSAVGLSFYWHNILPSTANMYYLMGVRDSGADPTDTNLFGIYVNGATHAMWTGGAVGNTGYTAGAGYYYKLLVSDDGAPKIRAFHSIDPTPVSWTAFAAAQGFWEAGRDLYWATQIFGTDTDNIDVANLIVTDSDDGFAPPAPGTPSPAATGETTMDVTWSDGSATTTNADSIVIERSLSSGSGFSEIDTVAIGVQTYSDSGLDPATTYYYRLKARVTALGTVYNSSATAEGSATTDSPPASGSDGEDLLALGEL